MNDGVATSLTDDEISPLDDDDRHEERRVTRVLERLPLRVRLAEHKGVVNVQEVSK